ncbi:MAG TPA: hypothetical protein VHD60_04890 [Candidatus Saccharimonadales bacterium]|nr:hypothetical protein [Candidatus Saccharimonadales bacterium]
MVLYQRPNKSILTAFVSVVAYIFATGWLADAGFTVFAVSLTVWAWQEVQSGVNWFRKVLGVMGLLAALVCLYLRLRGVLS